MITCVNCDKEATIRKWVMTSYASGDAVYEIIQPFRWYCEECAEQDKRAESAILMAECGREK